jgi:hypothetical protein
MSTKYAKSKLNYTIINEYFKLINTINDNYKKINANGGVRPNPYLASTINDIGRQMNIVKNFANGKSFSKNVKEFDGFVQTVSKIDTRKASILFNLVKEMNMLASKLGNLDHLTDAIAKSLSMELGRLTYQLVQAEKVINIAEAAQTKRQEEIRKSVDLINEMVAKPIVVTMDTSTQGGAAATSTGGATSGSSTSTPSLPTPATSSTVQHTTPQVSRNSGNTGGVTLQQILDAINSLSNKIKNMPQAGTRSAK